MMEPTIDNMKRNLKYSGLSDQRLSGVRLRYREYKVVAVQYFFEIITIGPMPYESAISNIRNSIKGSDNDLHHAFSCENINEAIEAVKTFCDHFGYTCSLED